jgi:hypothetical protein
VHNSLIKSIFDSQKKNLRFQAFETSDNFTSLILLDGSYQVVNQGRGYINMTKTHSDSNIGAQTIHLDGRTLEEGRGQLVRFALALSALTGQAITID